MKYSGINSVELDVPIVELEVSDGTIVDLYNDCDFHGTAFDNGTLIFNFVALAGVGFGVEFHRVTRLRVEQEPDWVMQLSRQIEYLLVRREGPWRKVLFRAGGCDYEFDCEAIRVHLP